MKIDCPHKIKEKILNIYLLPGLGSKQFINWNDWIINLEFIIIWFYYFNFMTYDFILWNILTASTYKISFYSVYWKQ